MKKASPKIYTPYIIEPYIHLAAHSKPWYCIKKYSLCDSVTYREITLKITHSPIDFRDITLYNYSIEI